MAVAQVLARLRREPLEDCALAERVHAQAGARGMSLPVINQ